MRARSSAWRSWFNTAITNAVTTGQTLEVTATHPATAKVTQFNITCRIDTPVAVDYYRNDRILRTVLRNMAKS